jgi:predicted RecB family nuclease
VKLFWQVLADVAAADAFAAKGASDIDARQMQATLRSLVADAVKSSTAQTDASPPANTQQAMLRYALARHGRSADMHGLTQQHVKYWKALLLWQAFSNDILTVQRLQLSHRWPYLCRWIRDACLLCACHVPVYAWVASDSEMLLSEDVKQLLKLNANKSMFMAVFLMPTLCSMFDHGSGQHQDDLLQVR